VINRNAQGARGALQKVVEDGGVSTFTAMAWPGWATMCRQDDVAMPFDGTRR